MKLSVVLPAYNEEQAIAGSLVAVDRCLSGLGLVYEIIVGDDGSTDGTQRIVRELGLPTVRVLQRPHRGKGAILTECLLASKGRYAGFLDADLEIDARYLPRFVKAMEEGFEAAIASKTLSPEARARRRAARRISTRGYNTLVRLLFGSPLSDHQAGLKLFRGEYLRSILPSISSTGWLWDTEVLLRFLRDGKRIVEIPVTTDSSRDSHVGILLTSWEMLGGLIKLYIAGRRQPN